MSYPHGDGFHSNSVEEVRSFLDDHHPNQYLVFNLSGHSYDTSKLNNQVCSHTMHTYVYLSSLQLLTGRSYGAEIFAILLLMRCSFQWQKRFSLERASQEEQNGTNFSFIAPSILE